MAVSKESAQKQLRDRAAENVRERIADAIRQHAEVVRGHDAVHPNRSDCGGVGNCALMRAELEAETEVTDLLVRAARLEVAP